MQRKLKVEKPKTKSNETGKMQNKNRKRRGNKPRADAKADVELTAMKARVSHLWE